MLGVYFTAGGLTSYGQNAADIGGRIEDLRRKAAQLKNLYPETAKHLEAQAQHLQDYGAYYASGKALLETGIDLVLPEGLLASKPPRGGYSRRLLEAFGRNTLEEGLSIGADQLVNAWAFGDEIDFGQGLYDLAVAQASQSPLMAVANERARWRHRSFRLGPGADDDGYPNGEAGVGEGRGVGNPFQFHVQPESLRRMRSMSTKKAARKATKKAAKKATKKAAKKASKRELIAPKGDKRYIRRDAKGRIKESDDVSRSLSQDRKRKATKKVSKGQGDKGDR